MKLNLTIRLDENNQSEEKRAFEKFADLFQDNTTMKETEKKDKT